MTDRPRAVVLRALGLGDLCTAVPALRALRRALPHHHLQLCTPAPLSPLVDWAGVADEVVPTRGLDRPLPSRLDRPDVAVNLHGRGPQSHRRLRALLPRRFVGFGSGRGPRWEDDEHEVDRWCRLVTSAFDVPCDPGDLRLSPPLPVEAAEPAPVLVHAGAAAAARRWPPERFAAVVRDVRRRGRSVVLTGGADERSLATEVAERAGCAEDPDCTVAAGETDLLQLAALVQSAAVVVCGDTGVAHLATALGRPAVVLFGPTSPEHWGPPRDGPQSVLWAGRTGDPHGGEPDPGLLAITVPEVLVALEAHVG